MEHRLGLMALGQTSMTELRCDRPIMSGEAAGSGKAVVWCGRIGLGSCPVKREDVGQRM